MFKLALLAIAAVAFISSSDMPRARLWIAAGGGAYLLSLLYSDLKLPYAPAFAVLCDFTICLMIYGLAAKRWELYLMIPFQASILVNILELMRLVPERYLYVYSLDVLNLLALLFIGGMLILERGGYGRNHFNSLLSPAYHIRSTLQQTRGDPPWWTVK